MSLRNIQEINDPSNRYKRPVTRITVEKKSKTRIVNISEIAKSLHVKSQKIITFLQKSMGKRISDDFIIPGIVSLEEIDRHIQKYINKHVLCKNCNLPEISKNTCLACGHIQKVKKEIKENSPVTEKMTKRQKDMEIKTCELLHLLDTSKIDSVTKKLYSDILWGEPTLEQIIVIENSLKSKVTDKTNCHSCCENPQ